MIILEGVDGAGKTSLGESLTRLGNWTVIHNPHRETNDLEQYYFDLVTKCPGNTIFDRSFLSEIIYGPLLRGHSRIDLQGTLRLCKIMSDRRGAIVYCYADKDVLRRRLSTTWHEHRSVLKHLDALLFSYELLMAQVKEVCKLVSIDTTSKSANVYAAELIEELL